VPIPTRLRNPKFVIAIGIVALIVIAGIVVAITTSARHNNNRTANALNSLPPVTTTTQPNPPCPYTGLPSPSPQIPQRNPIAVKVDNYPDARPQSGLDKADIVFEEPVEGGVTRLVAVFQCNQADLVGPIRSAREPDVAILDELGKPIFVHVGGIAPIEAMIQGANATNEDLYYDGSIVQHTPGRIAPYDTYISTSDAWNLFPKDTNPPSPLFNYSTSPEAGIQTTSIHIPFSSTNDNTWTWNATTSLWQLFIGGSQATLSTGADIAVPNVIVMTVQTYTGPWIENSQGAHEVEVDPTSGGTLQVLRNGVSISGTWSRRSIYAPMQLSDSAGNPIALNPGETWIEMVPSGIPVTNSPVG